MDYSIRNTANTKNESVFLEHYFFGSYSPNLENILNNALTTTVNNYFGNSFDLLDDVSMAFYNTYLFMDAAVTNSANLHSSTLRSYLYKSSVDTPVGMLSIDESNYVDVYPFLFQIHPTSQETITKMNQAISPQPYYNRLHDDKFLVTSFSSRPYAIQIVTDIVGIAFVLDLNDLKRTKSYYAYLQGVNEIEKYNSDGGIKQIPVRYELFNCPVSEDAAAGGVISRKSRSFYYTIGGCSPTIEQFFSPSYQSVEALLFYTAKNVGNECVQNILYMNTNPYQEIYPIALRVLYRGVIKPILVYNADESYNTRIQLFRSIMNEVGEGIIYEAAIHVENLDKDVASEIGIIHTQLAISPNVIVMLEYDYLETFLQAWSKKICQAEGLTQKECSEKYQLFIIDYTHIFIDSSYSSGNIFYTAFVDDKTDETTSYLQLAKDIGDINYHPTEYDVVIYITTVFVMQTLSESPSTKVSDVRSQLYKTSISSTLGVISLSEDNQVTDSINVATVDENSNLVYKSTITQTWQTNPYRLTMNILEYEYCDWKNNIGSEQYKDIELFGVILPIEKANMYDGISFLDAIITATVKVNADGGVLGKELDLVVFNDGNDPIIAAKRLREYYQKYKATIYFGGWTTDIRNALHEVALELDLLLFYPNDYEGYECHYNGLYMGTPNTAYYYITTWILENQKDTLILLYTSTDYSKSLANTFIKELGYYSIEFDYQFSIPIDNDDLTSVLDIVKTVAPSGAMIVSTLEGDSALLLVSQMKENQMDSSLYPVLSKNIDNIQIEDLGADMVGHYSIFSFNGKGSTNEVEAIIKSSVEDLVSLFTYLPQFVTNTARAYSMVLIASNLVNTAQSTNFTIIKPFVYTVKTITPVGVVEFAANNHASVSMSIQTVVKNGKEYEVSNIYETSTDMRMYPYYSLYNDANNVFLCKGNINDKVEGKVIKIGLFFSTTGSLAEIHRPVMYGALIALQKLFDVDGILGYSPVIVIKNYESDNNMISEKAYELFSDELVSVVIGCYDSFCRKAAQIYSIEYKVIFFYPRKSVGEECDYSTFYIGPVPNQYVPSMFDYLITLSVTKEIYFIRSNDSDSEVLQRITEYEAEGLFISKGSTVISSTNSLSTTMLTNIIQKSLSDGGVIMLAINDTQDLQTFLRIYTNLRLDADKYPVVDLLSEIDHYETFDNTYKANVYLFASYFYDITSEENKQFLTYASDITTVKHPTSGTNAAYGAVNLFVNAANDVGEMNIDRIRQRLGKISAVDGSGTIQMTDSHYCKLPLFIARYDSEGVNEVTVASNYNLQTPQAWNWNLEESYGTQCSFDESIDKEQYPVNAKRVLLLATITGSLSEAALGAVDAFKIAVNELNDNNNGVMGYTLKSEIYDSKSDDDECKSIIRDYVTTYKPPVIFYVGTTDCRNAVTQILKENNVMIFTLFQQNLDFCNENIMISTHHITLDKPLVNSVRNRMYDEVVVVADEIYFQGSGEYVYQQLYDLSVNTVYYTSITDVTEKIKSWYNSNVTNVAIMYRGFYSGFEEIEKNLDYYNLTEPNVRLIVIEPTSTIYLSSYRNYEVWEAYRAADEFEENVEFYNKMNARMNKETTTVTDITSALYSSAKVWANAVEEAKTFVSTSVRPYMTSLVYNSPEGQMQFGSNNYLKRSISDSFINEDGSSTLIHYTQYMHVPDAFKASAAGVYKLCDFDNIYIQEGSDVSTYIIGIALSFSGDLREIESPVFDALFSAITYLNDNDRVLSYYLNYKVYDIKSDPANYASVLTTAFDVDKVSYVFGGVTPHHYNYITEFMNDREEYFFFCGNVYSDFCPKNVISAQLYPQQIAEATVRKLMEDATQVILVHSTSNFSTSVNSYIESRLSNLNILLMGNIEYEGTQNSQQIKRLSIANSAGYFIATFEEKDIFELFMKDLCSFDMLPPNWIVLSTIFDENVLHELEPSCINGHKVIGSYFESVGDESLSSFEPSYLSSIFNQELHINIGTDKYFIPQYESAFSLLYYWKTVITSANTFDLSSFSLLYNYYVDTPSDSFELNGNHFFNRYVYSGVIENQKITINWHPTSYITPQIYNQWDGDLRGYVCDWNKGYEALHNNDPIHVAFIHESDIGSASEKYNLLIQNMAIDEINDGNGILNKLLIPDHYFVISSKVYAQMRTIITETENLKIIFGCMTPECRTEAQRYLSAAASQVLFGYLGRETGDTCSINMFMTGSTINQKAEATLSYIKLMGMMDIIIIGNAQNSYIFIYYYFIINIEL